MTLNFERERESQQRGLRWRHGAVVAQVSEFLFNHTGTLRDESPFSFALMEQHEANITACMDRADELLALARSAGA